ncbi:MAG: tRNA 4-thiouridine(8) synthase ThiI [Bacilli bacterium]|nr:tRNA 4-thiouridine(8) synthase ThiI [Bacilli bacterium]
MKYNVIIVRFGEMSTKGKNKKDFVAKLARSIRIALRENEDDYKMVIRHDHIYLYIINEIPNLEKSLSDVSGMYSFSLACKIDDPDLENLKDFALKVFNEEEGKTFKIRARRIDKSYPFISDEINREIATVILKNTSWRVDVHNPDIILDIEIRSDGAYVFTKTIKGMGGYPTGSIGKCLMMLSGGIDSPVATYLLMRRGVEVTCIHFAAPPYTNSGVIDKLEDILQLFTKYQSKIRLFIVPFTKIQEKIYEISSEGYPITIMRRMMYRIASKLAVRLNIPALASGESVGQVASQTIDSLNVINSVTNIPVLRPLCTYDKVDIIRISEKIGTYDISIRPYEDCCTIFAPVKPKTSPHMDECLRIESLFDFDPLIEECLNNLEVKYIKVDN